MKLWDGDWDDATEPHSSEEITFKQTKYIHDIVDLLSSKKGKSHKI